MSKAGRKSDDLIVPEKRVNKETGITGTAESVEGRGSTKGKERQFNTGQTQRWETVQSKLMLLHQKAEGHNTIHPLKRLGVIT